MMHSSSETTYQAAKAVAKTIEEHFRNQLTKARAQGNNELAPEPSAAVIESIIDTLFWSSLRREEGVSPKISLAYVSPEQAGAPIIFEHRLELTSAVLAKLSPAVERPGVHLGVWQDEGKLYIWGATRVIPSLCFVLDVSAPALLVIKHRRIGGVGKFANVAVLKGDQVKVINEQAASLPDCPSLLATLLNFSSSYSDHDGVNILVQLAVSMRAHGRGGTLLIVQSGTDSWKKSIIHPILYSIAPAFHGLADLMRQEQSERSKSIWQGSLRNAVEGVAGLTAVDGATIITNEYELLAFGAKIGRPEGKPPIDKVVFTEPIVGNQPTTLSPAQRGGTRHLSAAQFVQDQPNAFALVASQDGAFTIYAWSACDEVVYAHRVDTLLL
ncbi:putative sensor domain DACNV-containing protein [Pontibacter rugosus]|uniref:Sensor domain DACNV-containing protein n=1 Tax=Pontibacter rugosus TaxID=1745966 RepID=A0ABW3SV05_9BACT